MATPAPMTLPPGINHGTSSAYVRHRCRCPQCRAWRRLRGVNEAERRRQLRAERRTVAPVLADTAPSVPSPTMTEQSSDADAFELPCGHVALLGFDWPEDGDDDAMERLGHSSLQCPECGRPTTMAEVFDILVSAPVTPPAPIRHRVKRPPGPSVSHRDVPGPRHQAVPVAPAAWAVRGAVGRWRCGHEMTIPRVIDDRRPGAAPCPICGRPGLVAQWIGNALAPVAGRP